MNYTNTFNLAPLDRHDELVSGLRNLHVSKPTKPKDAVIKVIKKIPSLKYVNISGCKKIPHEVALGIARLFPDVTIQNAGFAPHRGQLASLKK